MADHRLGKVPSDQGTDGKSPLHQGTCITKTKTRGLKQSNRDDIVAFNGVYYSWYRTFPNSWMKIMIIEDKTRNSSCSLVVEAEVDKTAFWKLRMEPLLQNGKIKCNMLNLKWQTWCLSAVSLFQHKSSFQFHGRILTITRRHSLNQRPALPSATPSKKAHLLEQNEKTLNSTPVETACKKTSWIT